MRGNPIAGLRPASAGAAGSARPPAGSRTAGRHRARRWSPLDLANAIGIVFGLSCLVWLPAQAALASVLPAVAVSPVAGSPASPAADARPASPTASPAAPVAAGDVAVASLQPAASSQPDATSRIVAGSKPLAGGQVVPANRSASQATAANPTPLPAPVPAVAPATYTRDLYDGSVFRYQDPDGTACTAAATEDMLNLIQRGGTTGTGFTWSATTSYQTQEDVLAWERAHDTLDAGAPGSDPHGWRNALNYYGWGTYTTFGARPYEDLAYSSFAAAAKAAVLAIARENKPVGILAWSGGHAQIMTGYEVYGSDPETSTDFDVVAVYLSDPLAGDGLLDARITYSNFKSGSTLYRFTAYDWTDSAADDPYMPGTKASYTEWYGKWVIIAPVSFDSATPGGR